MEDTVPVRSVKKALDLLDQIVVTDLESRVASLGELARRAGMPSNSAHNLLKTLTACGYVTRRDRGRYVPGVKLRQLGRLNRARQLVGQGELMGHLRRFVESRHEACILTVLARGERVVVGCVDSDQAVRVSHTSVAETPFYEVPTGRMLAAMASEAELQEIIEHHGLPGDQWDGIADIEALRAELDVLRNQGWCRIVGPESGLLALACPVMNEAGQAWGVIGTYAPAYRCSTETGDELLSALRKLADELTKESRMANVGGQQ